MNHNKKNEKMCKNRNQKNDKLDRDRKKRTSRSFRGTVLIVMASVLVFSGCSQEKKHTDNTVGVTGRYQETELALPELEKNETVITLKEDGIGNSHLYTSLQENELQIKDYLMQKDDSFHLDRTITIDDLDPKQVDVFDVCPGYDGYCYVSLSVDDDEYYDSYLYECDPSKQAKRVTWKGVSDAGKDDLKEGTEEYEHDNDAFNSFYVLEGNQLIIEKSNLYKYQGADQPLEAIMELPDDSESYFIMGNHKVAMFGEENDGLNKLTLYDVETKETQEVSMDFISSAGLCGYITADDNVILCSSDGIYEKEKDTTIWKQVLDGSKFSMYSPAYYVMGMTELDDNNYAILYSAANDVELMKYEYVKDSDAKQKTQLTIYTLNVNTALREAVTVFRRNHPDVEVTIEEAMQDEDTGAMKSDYIKALNTELLNHGGADIINLDGMDMDSYIQHGALVDLSSLLTPMITNGEILPNVMEQYKVGDAYYATPVFINLPILYSQNGYQLDQLDWITHSQSVDGKVTVPNMEWKDLMNYVVPIYYKDLVQDDQINQDKIKELLSEMKAYKEIKDGQSMSDDLGSCQLAEGVSYYIEESHGFTDIVFPLAIQNMLHGTMQTMENSFMPTLQLGINKNCEHVDLAKEFIAIMLSEEIQKFELFYGFPINTKAIQAVCDSDPQYDAEMSYVDSNNVEHTYPVKWLTKENKKQVIGFLDQANNKAVVDDSILKIFVDNTEEYIDQKCELDEAVTKIKDQLNLYLNEK